MDINLGKVISTWINRHARENRVAKCLDCFVVSEVFLESVELIQKWVFDGGDSDHYSIIWSFWGVGEILSTLLGLIRDGWKKIHLGSW